MNGLENGLKHIRNSLILWLIGIITPIVFIGATTGSILALSDLNQVTGILGTASGVIAVMGIIGLAAIYLLYKGWGELCYDLDPSFCRVQRVIKYGFVVLLLSLIAFFAMNYSSLAGAGNQLAVLSAMLTTSPLLILAVVSALAIFLAIIYGFYKLGDVLANRNIKVGALLLIGGPIAMAIAMPQLLFAITLAALIILLLSINGLIKAKAYLEEGVIEGEEVYEELKERRPKKPTHRPIYEEPEYEEPSRTYRPPDREVAYYPEAPERRMPEPEAQLLGPGGFRVRIRTGIYTFGRRDFAGFVPEEDLNYISRRHFEIKATSQGFFIRDLGSLNGTWVNGKKLGRGESIRLSNGSIIDVAEVVRLKFLTRESDDLGVPSI